MGVGAKKGRNNWFQESMTWLPAAKFWRLADACLVSPQSIRLSTILDSDDRVEEFDEVFMCIVNVSIDFLLLSL